MASHERSGRHLRRAELLSVGTELTVGETRDTNAGELARTLSDRGVRVGRLTAVPDDLEIVVGAFRSALERTDLVVSTGGLGPTPDDLTREAIAAVCGEDPTVDPDLERWLRELFHRRGVVFPEANLKQAWRIPSAVAIPNEHGTAPGWWVDRPDGRVIVALPGPPREMRPLWTEWVLPRLERRGLGSARIVRTFRLAGIGESHVAHLLGEEMLRNPNPQVATYARSDAVDVRVSAHDEILPGGVPGRSAAELAAATEAAVAELLGPYIWGYGEQTWAEVIGDRLDSLGWRLALVEMGTSGTVSGLLGELRALVRAEILMVPPADAGDVPELARVARTLQAHVAGAPTVGLAVAAVPVGSDTRVDVAVVTPVSEHFEDRTVFLSGAQGRSRAALAGAAVLNEELRRCADLGTARGGAD